MSSITLSIDRTAEGRFRASIVDLPEMPTESETRNLPVRVDKSTGHGLRLVEANSFDELMSGLRQELIVVLGVAGTPADLPQTNDQESLSPDTDDALHEIEKTALRGRDLDRLAKASPPPQSWFDEPEM